MAAWCAVDRKKTGGTFSRFPQAEVFEKYRVMLAKRKDIEAVMIATPDPTLASLTLAGFGI